VKNRRLPGDPFEKFSHRWMRAPFSGIPGARQLGVAEVRVDRPEADRERYDRARGRLLGTR
jgi:hypothetical protein